LAAVAGRGSGQAVAGFVIAKKKKAVEEKKYLQPLDNLISGCRRFFIQDHHFSSDGQFFFGCFVHKKDLPVVSCYIA